MAISVSSSPAPVSGSAARDASSVGVTFASAPSENDLIVLILGAGDGWAGSDGSSNVGTLPSGFVEDHIVVMNTGTGELRYIRIASKKAGASEGTTYTVTGFGTTNTTTDALGGVKKALVGLVLTGETSWQAEVTGSTTSTGGTAASGTITIPTVDATIADTAYIAGVVSRAAGIQGADYSSWTSWTERGEQGEGGAGNDIVLGVASNIVTDGAASSGTVTIDTTSDDDLALQVGYNAPAAGGLSIPIASHHYRGMMGA